MVRTFASFLWDITIPESDEPPYASTDVAKFVDTLRSTGLDVTPAEDDEYAWYFDCRLPHVRMSCRLGMIGGSPDRWLLACRPCRGLMDWLLRHHWEPEQEGFVRRIAEVFQADSRVCDVRWYSRAEWDRSGI